MSSTIDSVSPYVTGTLVMPLSASYARGCPVLVDWLPSTYTLAGGRLVVEDGVDYRLSELLAGKLPSDASDAERLYHTYGQPAAQNCLDGWLSTADPYFVDNHVATVVQAVLGYTVGLSPDLKAVWPTDQQSLADTTIVLLKDGTPVATSKYVVTLTGLWWTSEVYSDLPLDLYTGVSPVYSLSVTRTSTREDQLNGVEIIDTKLIDPVVGTDDLTLEALNTGADVCDAAPKSISLYSNQTSKVVLQPYDKNGRLVDLTDKDVIPVFTIREDRQSRNLTGKYTCTQTEDDTFEVVLKLRQPGVYVAQLMLFDTSGQILLHVTDYYIAVQPSGAYGGAVSVPEVRYHLMDGCAQRNELIDAFEFSDSDIINAIHSTIEFFNGATGAAHTSRYTSINFPSDGRYFLKQGVCAALLRSKAILMARNQLPYNAGGVSIDDQNKSPVYLQLSQLLDADWRMYVGRRHSYESMRRSFMSI